LLGLHFHSYRHQQLLLVQIPSCCRTHGERERNGAPRGHWCWWGHAKWWQWLHW
jgi:hypothetical protein